MKALAVILTRRGRRTLLRCVRPDGSLDAVDVGAGVPQHDLAHFVAETLWRLPRGFFGHIAAGYTFTALSDKVVIARLGPEALQAEVLARAVGSLVTGACSARDFDRLVNCELEHSGLPLLPISPEQIELAAQRFRDVHARFARLAEGESLRLEFALHEDRDAPSAA